MKKRPKPLACDLPNPRAHQWTDWQCCELLPGSYMEHRLAIHVLFSETSGKLPAAHCPSLSESSDDPAGWLLIGSHQVLHSKCVPVVYRIHLQPEADTGE